MRRFFLGLAILAMSLQVPVARADDGAIADAIVDSLESEKAKGNLKDFNIGLHVEDGAVYLSGQVASRKQERLALDAARQAEGVQQVFNQMKIGRTVTVASAEDVVVEAVAEEETEAEVVEATKPSRGRIGSAVKGALATVSRPTLATPEMRQAAPLRAPSDSRSAKQIASEIIAEFRDEKARGNLRGFGIDVEVDRGTVWLKGHVSTKAQRDLALDIARHVSGVKQVVDDLKIENASHLAPMADRSDDAIAEELVQLLQRQKQSGHLRDFGIDVQVDAGTVWMSGYVASAAQQHRVLEAARYISGVKQVVDDLTVKDGYEVQAAQAQQVLPQGYGNGQQPLAYAQVNHQAMPGTSPAPMMGGAGYGTAGVNYDHPQMPGYAWPSYASHPNYGAVTYPKQYSPAAWPYIGPFYPYPQVPLGWRKVTLEWDDGWWYLDFKNRR